VTDTLIELEGCDGEWWDLTNGTEGAFLAEEVKGAFYDPPVKVVDEEPGNYPGSRYLNHRVLRRDCTFGVEILNDESDDSWLSRDSRWRKSWSFDRDTKLWCTTNESGSRYLKMRLGESMELADTRWEPMLNSINRTNLVTYSYDPFWHEDDVTFTAVTKTDTRFDPSRFTPPWPWQELPKEELVIRVDASHGGVNPTDNFIYPVWTVPASQEPIPDFPWPFPPGIAIPFAKAPFTQFAIPDYCLDPDEDDYDKHKDRRVKTPGLIYGENAVINTDPRKEQIEGESGSELWARMNGVRWRYPIPPYTEKCDFKISVSGCAAGQVIQLSLPRQWSRPWGLE
jgi:hypothetical protein